MDPLPDLPPQSWQAARAIAATRAALPPITVPLLAAVGGVLAAPLRTAVDLPVADCAATIGWAVAGVGPWSLLTAEALADMRGLPDGCALPVSVGDALPPGTSAVLVAGSGMVEPSPGDPRVVVAHDGRPADHSGTIPSGTGITARGTDAAAGTQLLSPGRPVAGPTVGLAAAAGLDELTVIPPPTIAPLLFNLGMARRGHGRLGRPRDVHADLVAAWLEAGPARWHPPVDVTPGSRGLARLIDDLSADVIVVGGGAEPGVGADVTAVLRMLAAEPLLGDCDVWPGPLGILAVLPGDRYLIALSGSVPAAVVTLATLLDPLLAALASAPSAGAEPADVLLVPPHLPTAARAATVLLPARIVTGEFTDAAEPLAWAGPHGLAELAAADALVALPQRTVPGRRALVPSIPVPGHA